MSVKRDVLITLSDGEWHSMVELGDISHRFGGRVDDLRKGGLEIDVVSGKHLYQLGIVSKPYTATFFFYRLSTPKHRIDFDRCALKPAPVETTGQIGLGL